VNEHANLGGGGRVEAAGEQRPNRPAQHVAGASGGQRGTRDRTDRHRPRRRSDHGARTLENDHGPRRGRETPGDPDAIGLDVGRRHTQEAAHLRRVRRQHARGGRRRQRGHRVRAERVECVGVEHRGDWQRTGQPVHGRPHPWTVRDAGADRGCLGARGQAKDVVRRLRISVVVAARVARGHHLDDLGVEGALPGRRRGDRHQASARAQPGHPDQGGGAGLARRARDHQQVSRAALVRGHLAPRQPIRDPGVVEETRRLGRAGDRDPEVDQLDSAHRRLGVDVEPELARAHGRGEVGAKHGPGGAARVGVEPRRDVDRQLESASGVHRRQRRRRHAGDLAPEADPEHGIDHQGGAREPLAPRIGRGPRPAVLDRHAAGALERRQHHRGITRRLGAAGGEQHAGPDPGHRELARDHEPVTAVGACAAHDHDRRLGRTRQLAASDVGDAAARVLHEQQAGHAEVARRRRVGGPHLGRGQ